MRSFSSSFLYLISWNRYVEYWRQRFAKTSIDKVFPKIVPKEGDPYFGTTDYYFEMAESLPEDYSLRQRLAMRRLEEVCYHSAKFFEGVPYFKEIEVFLVNNILKIKSRIDFWLHLFWSLNIYFSSSGSLRLLFQFIGVVHKFLSFHVLLYYALTFNTTEEVWAVFLDYFGWWPMDYLGVSLSATRTWRFYFLTAVHILSICSSWEPLQNHSSFIYDTPFESWVSW